MSEINSNRSNLDSQQIFQRAFDEDKDRLRVDAELSATIIPPPGLEVNISQVDDSIRIGDGTNLVTTTTISSDIGLDVNVINPISVEIDAADGDNIAIHDADGDALNINADGSINSVVTANNLDIRDITHLQDSIKIGDGTDFASITASGELNVLATAQPGIDIGDVTINNAAGASAVNIQDGGNSITVDGTVTANQGGAPWSVVGNVASGVTDSGNPIKIAGVYNTALPILTNGQRGDIQLDSSARQIIAPLTNSSIVKAQLQDNSGTAITLGQKTMASSVPVTIASDQPVPLQQLVDGNKLYSAAVNVSAASAGIDNPLILIRNPIGSGKKIYLINVKAGTSIANVSFSFGIFSTPTVTTNGTAATVTSRHIGGGAPSAVTLVTTLPTVSSNGAELYTAIQGQNSNSISFEESFGLELEAGTSILITGNPLSNNRLAQISILWAEI